MAKQYLLEVDWTLKLRSNINNGMVKVTVVRPVRANFLLIVTQWTL